MSASSQLSSPLITALLNPDCYDHPAEHIQLIETHISWVILTGTYVYKIKKPVDLGFLDFSTLQKRQFYCEEELRLNQRLAPDIYLAVVPITGTFEQPVFGGKGEAIEFAVKMRQFPQEDQLDHVLARGELQASQIDSAARVIADFHQRIAIAGTETDFGNPEHVYQPIEENFAQINQNIPDKNHLKPLARLQHWSENSFNHLKQTILQRKINGFIRECHGDIHLRNLAWYNNKPLIFDCLEFNPNLRWIDVINDIAFLIMDLQDRQQPRLANRCLNTYLEITGDYEGVTLLPFYLLYRATVLAKVNAIRARQITDNPEQRSEAEDNFMNYMQLGLNYTHTTKPKLIITHGLSGSGKSTVSHTLVEQLGAIRVRSDVERKRLFDVKPDNHGQDVYTEEATLLTYNRLAELAGIVLEAGYSVIIDAAFLQLEQRESFQELARGKQLPYIILEFTTSIDTLRQRINNRKNDVSDADMAVLEQQLSVCQALQDSERMHAIEIDTDSTVNIELITEQITAGNRV